MTTIRSACPEDAPAIAEIWEQGWRDAHLGNVPDELITARTPESFRTRAAERIGDTIVAEASGEVVGFVMLAGDELDHFYVAAAHRGAGVADALMAEAERRLQEAGHDRVWLAVVAGNVRARRFYARQGWTDDGPFVHAAPGPDGPIQVPAHRYVKDLA